MTGTLEPFEPHNRRVGLYVCGPTLYDCCHLGHARTYVSFDVIVRYLKYKGYEVEYVTNLTDFSETVIARAKKANEDPLELSRRFERSFFEDMNALDLRSVNKYPRASDHVQEVIAMIEGLIQKGIPYESNGTIFFDTKKFRDFGRLSHRRRISRLLCNLLSVSVFNICSTLHPIYPAAMEALFYRMCRLLAFLRCTAHEGGPRKRHPCDFILWKCVGRNELGWESPWGRGRPGWHTECSAMSIKHLGPELDIHGGGEELKFPHHESEIALSESYTGKKPFVKYWIHTGSLILNGRKMSKSSRNVATVRDLLTRHTVESLRLLILSKQYRRRINLTEDELIRCEEMTRKMRETRDALSNLTTNPSQRESDLKEEKGILEQISTYKAEFLRGMDNDFDSAIALSNFCELIRLAEAILSMRVSKYLIETALSTINELGNILGLLARHESPSAF